jgi:hypothetical protein
MRKIYIICYTLLFSSIALGQEGMPTIVPPSPEAASVFKFTEVPVSLYSGLANMNVPLFEIESDGVKIPINISYHSRGIKVAEVASRVGLGWSLNYGGMVSKQMRGYYDGYSYCLMNNYIDLFSNATMRWNVFDTQGTSHESNRKCDLIPDQYFFDFLGVNGKFIFDYNDGEILMQKFSNIKIIKTDFGSNDGFKIVDGSGNTFYFGENNMTDTDYSTINFVAKESGDYTSNSESSDPLVINTWHLTKIKTQLGKEILFIYENEQSFFHRRSYDKFDHENEPNEYKSYFSNVISNQKRIKEIHFEKGKLEFNYFETDREDLAGSKALKEITMYDNYNKVIKKVKLVYDYTTSQDDGNINFYLNGMDLRAKKRLFLKSLEIQNDENSMVLPYQFEYDEQLLPSRHSNSIDYWGYFNGRTNGQFLRDYLGHPNSSRAVDTLKSEAGLLKKITKPEGGSIHFHYEHNKVLNTFPNTIVYDGTNPIAEKHMLLTPLSHADFDSIRGQLVYSSSENIYRKAFSISEGLVGQLKYRTSTTGDENCNSVNYNNCDFIVTIRRLSDDSIVRPLPVTPDMQYVNTLVPPGDYVLAVKPKNINHDPLITMSEHFNVDLDWIEEVERNLIYTSGKRIKKIEYRDDLHNVEFFKTYKYINPETGITSGKLLGLASFYSRNSSSWSEGFHIVNPMGNVPGEPFSTYQGNTLGYEWVTEYFGEGENTIGKTVHQYTIPLDTGLYYYFPYHPPTDNEWLRGKELSVQTFKKNLNGSYNLVRKTENKYLYGDEIDGVESSNPSVFMPIPVTKHISQDLDISLAQYLKNPKKFRLPIFTTTGHDTIPGHPQPAGYKTYHFTGGAVDLWKTKTTEYYDNGEELVTSTQYGYDYDRHYGVAATQQTTSDGNVFWNRYQYAQSMEMQNDPMSSILIAKNMVDVVLRKETRRNLPEKLSAEVTRYKDWGNGIIAPEIIQTSKGLNNLEDRIKYIDYDLHGNPLEVKQENGISISYIWAYNHTLPVAKIENISYAQIPQNAIEAIHNSTDVPYVYDENLVLGAFENLRASLASFTDCMITTFTYKPLVGVSTMTDPKEQKTTYEYDSFGRLEFVIDHLGNILSKNEYNYRTQN